MNVVLIRQKYNPFGGAERFVSRALAALNQQHDLQLHLIARAWQPIEGIHFHRCTPFYLERVSRDFGFARCAIRTARQLGADLIQSHERLVGCDVYRAGDGVHRVWLAQRGRTLNPLARWLQTINPYHVYVKWAERRMFESTALRAVICNSQLVQRQILDHFRIAPEKLHVIYNGIDSQQFQPASDAQRQRLRQQHDIDETETVYVFVGSGYERKGLSATLQALAAIDQGLLLVIGHDKHSSRYQEQAHALGLAQRVRFLGGQAEVRDYYHLADALVLPTLYDPFPNAVLEAMACGLAIITSEQSGCAELINSGGGLVCDALDVASLSGFMQQLQDRPFARQLGANARQIAQQLDWSHIGPQLTALYQTLLKP